MIFLLIVFLLAELIYFRFADQFGIVDKPNKRSSHHYITRRGGGILFPLAWLTFSAANEWALPWFTAGLIAIAAVSFIDDIREVGVKARLSVHVTSLCLAFYEFGLFESLPWWGLAVCLLAGIATLNAINFMDGINGITGLYAMVFWISVCIFAGAFHSSLLYSFDSPYAFILASLVVFGFFNFRKRALCFAGDVGSVSMAYLMTGVLLTLLFKQEGTPFGDFDGMASTGNNTMVALPMILLLAIYGTDSFLTIVHRILLKENILQGHRRHLYQYLVNELKWPHLNVAVTYAGLQFMINIWLFNNIVSTMSAVIFLTIAALTYAFIKLHVINIAARNQALKIPFHEPAPETEIIPQPVMQQQNYEMPPSPFSEQRRKVFEGSVTEHSSISNEK